MDVITSPNMEYIPHPVVGELAITRRANGHFGVHDPIQWPQFIVNSS